MRSLALLLVLMAAFYVLLADQNKSGGSGKSKPAAVENKNESSFFSEGLPGDFMAPDLSRFGTMDKLKDDLNYRRMKMDHQIEKEMKDFKINHDISGKDKEAYQDLVKKHNQARSEFHDKYVEQIKEYKKMKIETYEENDKGLR